MAGLKKIFIFTPLIFFLLFLFSDVNAVKEVKTITYMGGFVPVATANTNYSKTFNFNPPDGLSSSLYVKVSITADIPTANTRIYAMLNGSYCNPQNYSIASAGNRYTMEFDCSGVVNKKAIYEGGFRANNTIRNVYAEWMLTYYNDPSVNVASIGGTEYSSNENARIVLQVLDNQGNSINNGDCYTTIRDSQDNIKTNNENLNYISGSNGLYYYQFTTSLPIGVYSVDSYCMVNGNKILSADTFHVAQWSEEIKNISGSSKTNIINFFGTEYQAGEPATAWLQLLRDYQPLNDASCYMNIYFPNKTLYLNRTVMTYLNDSDGIYYYDLIAPSTQGVYMLSAVCRIPADAFSDDFNDYSNLESYENITVTGGKAKLTELQNQCYGIPTACENIYFQNLCQAQSGCMWKSQSVLAVDVQEFIWQTIDDGLNWTNINTGFSGQTADAIEMASCPNSNLFIVDDTEHIYKSINSGVTWTLANSDYNGAESQDAKVMKCSKFVDGSLMIIEGDNNVWMSIDNGITWIKTADDFNLNYTGIAYGLASNQTGDWFAVDTSSRIWTSHNGINWTMINSDYNGGDTNDPADYEITTDNVHWILQGTSRDVWKSTNGGYNWTRTTEDFGGTTAGVALAYDGQLLYITNNNEDIWTSSDGIVWNLKKENINGANGHIPSISSSKNFNLCHGTPTPCTNFPESGCAGQLGCFWIALQVMPYTYAIWHLNENNGTNVSDSSGNGRNGTTAGSPTWVSGKLNNALQFDGASQWVNFTEIANFERTQNVTYEFWFNTSATAMSVVLSKYDAVNSRGLMIYLTAGKLYFDLRGAGTAYIMVTTVNAFNDGLWHHAVITYNGSSLASGVIIYVDNIIQVLTVGKDTLGSYSTLNNASFYIGRRSAGNYWSGKLDEVVIYNSTLTPAEVSFRYNLGNGTESMGGIINTVSGHLTSKPITLDELNWLQYLSNYTLNDGNITFNVLNSTNNVICTGLGNISSCANTTSPIKLYAELTRPLPNSTSPEIDKWWLVWELLMTQEEIRGAGEIHVSNTTSGNMTNLENLIISHNATMYNESQTIQSLIHSLNSTVTTYYLNLNQTLYDIKNVLDTIYDWFSTKIDIVS